MKRRTIFTLTSTLLFLFLAAKDSARAESSCEVTIGVIAPLSGKLAEYGTAVQNGIELARANAPETLACVKFIYEDDLYDPKLAITALQKLSDQDHVSAVFQFGNEPSIALAPVAERKGMALITMSQDPQVATATQPHVVRFMNTATNWQRGMADHLRKQQVRSVLVLKTEMSFTDMMIKELTKHLRGDVQVRILDSVLPTETDFRVLIAKAKREEFDLFGLYLLPSQSVVFLKQAAEMNFHPRIFSSTFLESRSVLAPVWSQLQGAIYLHLAVESEFREQYRSRFGKEDQIPYAWAAYQFALFVGRSIVPEKRKLQSLTADDVLRVFRSDVNTAPMKYVSEEQWSYFRFPLAIEMVDGSRTKTVELIAP